MSDLILLGDEAWTPEEWEAEQKRLQRDRARYRQNPRRREQVRAAVAKWRAKNPQYQREWQRLHRSRLPRVIGSLHELACTGPTKATGCRCKKIKVYDKPVEKAA